MYLNKYVEECPPGRPFCGTGHHLRKGRSVTGANQSNGIQSTVNNMEAIKQNHERVRKGSH
jgi:hypothetical protein